MDEHDCEETSDESLFDSGPLAPLIKQRQAEAVLNDTCVNSSTVAREGSIVEEDLELSLTVELPRSAVKENPESVIGGRFPSSAEQMAHATPHPKRDILLMSGSFAGPSNVSAQLPHFMGCTTSTPHDETEEHRAAGGTLRILNEVEKLLLPRVLLEREERLAREDEYLVTLGDAVLQALQSCNAKFQFEGDLLDDKVAALQACITRLHAAKEMMMVQRGCVSENLLTFNIYAQKVMRHLPSEYNATTFKSKVSRFLQ